MENDDQESLVAGTIMSIQEKKSSKGTPFAIIKFSDNTSEFELFLFSELLINNREKLQESNSFILTLQKDRHIGENSNRRVNIRKILNLSEMVNKSYDKVSIVLNNAYDVQELKNTLKEEGETKIEIIVMEENKKFVFNLEKPRKFNLNIFNDIKGKQYVKKIAF
jgi:DNA polymerase-3 subunit alpha